MTTWLINGLDTAYGNLSFMVWNSFLALIPLFLSFWLFRDRTDHARPIAWWLGFMVFVAFLPNAPYVLTDIIHLVKDIRGGASMWAIALILVPQYFLFISLGVIAYTLSLVHLGRYLCREGKSRWVLPTELTLHALTSVGIYLGRFPRFNSWDLLTRPMAILSDVLSLLTSKWPLAVMIGTFLILTVLYWLLKQLTLATILYWRTRNLRAAHRL